MPLLFSDYSWMEDVNRVLPGTMGIALGRNPNGIVQDLREGFAPLGRAPLALGVTLASTGVVLGLRWADVVSGFPFAGLLIAAVLSGGLLLRLGALPSSDVAPEELADEDSDVPLEWLGIDRPFHDDDVAALDRALGLEGVPVS